MGRWFPFAAGPALCAVALSAGQAQAGDAVVSQYDLVSKGLTVGHVEAARSPLHRADGEYVLCRVRTEVDVSLLMFSVHKEVTEESVLGTNGVVEYRSYSYADGHTVEVEGALREGAFHFSITEDGVPRTWVVPRSDYAWTSQDGVELRMAEGSQPQTLRILSFGDLRVLRRTFTWAGREELEVGSDRVACRIVEVADRRKHMRRWVTQDELGMAIVRQDGTDPQGSYSMRPVSIGRVPDANQALRAP